MTLPTCPACGLRQILRAPRCARCGAPLDGSLVIPPGGSATSATGSNDGSVGGADPPSEAPTTAFGASDQPTAEFPVTGDLTEVRGQSAHAGPWNPVPGPTPASASPWGPGSAARQGRPRGLWRRLGRR